MAELQTPPRVLLLVLLLLLLLTLKRSTAELLLALASVQVLLGVPPGVLLE